LSSTSQTPNPAGVTYTPAPCFEGTVTLRLTANVRGDCPPVTDDRIITITKGAIAHFVTPPGNITVACGGAGSAPVVSYTNEGSGDCAISGQVTAVRTGSAPICGGTLTDTWTYTDACQRQ
jgi:hypothetical protein